MKIFSWNVNGLRAVHRKGALEIFLKQYDPDILLLQEIKGKPDQFDETLTDTTYTRLFNPAEKAGYSGVAVWIHPRISKIKSITKGMEGYSDDEGRIIQTQLAEDTVIIGVYVPNGGKSDEAYADKLQFFKLLKKRAQQLQQKNIGVIIAGDFNVARSEIDVEQPEKFQKHRNFCLEIREHMESLINGANMIDTFRERNPTKQGAYTYWDAFDFSLPKGTRPREVNRGWRLDYMLTDEMTNKKVSKPTIHSDIFGSDHCPVSITVNTS